MLPEGQQERLNLAAGVDEEILVILREMRRGPDNTRAQRPGGLRRLNVIPGRSVSTPRDPGEEEDSSISDDDSDEDVVETHAETVLESDESSDNDDPSEINKQRRGLVEDLQLPKPTVIKTGDWLLVRFAGGKRGRSEFRYVAQALRDMDGEDEVFCQGYHSKDSAKTQFVLEADTFYVGFDDVISSLNEPETKISNTGRIVVVEFFRAVNTKEK